jgi:hypothetical protein
LSVRAIDLSVNGSRLLLFSVNFDLSGKAPPQALNLFKSGLLFLGQLEHAGVLSRARIL